MTDRKSEPSLSGNPAAWQDTYDAWVARYGTPAEAVAKLWKNPAVSLEPLRRHLGVVIRICNGNLWKIRGHVEGADVDCCASVEDRPGVVVDPDDRLRGMEHPAGIYRK